ncbi:MAG: hypothetical protein WBC91_02445 [Phototrophicaceae bacterium]
MSDKYYLHDCNAYIHSYQSTYRAECNDSKISVEQQDKQQKSVQNLSWWQRMLGIKPQVAQS